MECDAEIDRAFADGLTSQEVFQRVDSLYETKIEEYEERLDNALSNNEENYDQILELLGLLEVHRNHLCCPSIDKRWGSLESKLEE